MGTSHAAKLPKTKRMKNVPSSLRNPVRNASTVIDAVLSASLPVSADELTSTVSSAAHEGASFAIGVREKGFKKAVEMRSLEFSETFPGPSIAKSLWDSVTSNMDPKLANSPFGRLAESAFKKTISSIVTKGSDAMGEKDNDRSG